MNSNNNSKTRYFKNPILESLAYTSALTLNLVFIPIALFFTFLSFHRHSITIACLGISAGLFIWSFIEYVMHRFAFHFKFKNEKLKNLHAIFHLSHHQFMHDKRKYQTLMVLSFPSAVLYYYLLKSLLGMYAEPVFTGMIIGYVFYEFTHYSTHSMKMDSILVRHLKQHHMHHHFLDSEKNFGVTSAFWDIVFRTRLTKNEKMKLLQKKANVSL
jgi:sterol desaturase/sphingolipid hydroxylase (fatty acid hydroxylase superfamily)